LHAQLLADRLHLSTIGETEFIGIDMLIANRDNRIAAAAGDEGPLDAPYTKGCRKKKQQALGKPGLGDFSQHVEHRKANLVIIKSSHTAKQSEFLRTIRTGIEEPVGKSPNEAQLCRNL
jgi:hypothetical protein